jgi:hypothetical protein
LLAVEAWLVRSAALALDNMRPMANCVDGSRHRDLEHRVPPYRSTWRWLAGTFQDVGAPQTFFERLRRVNSSI